MKLTAKATISQGLKETLTMRPSTNSRTLTFVQPANRCGWLIATFLLALVFLTAAEPLYSAQGLRLIPGQVATRTIPNQAKYQNIGSFTVDFRFGPYVAPPDNNYSQIFTVGGLLVRWFVVGNMINVMSFDPIPDGANSFNLDMTGRTEFVMRIRRDYEKKQVSVEIWNPDGSNYRLLGSRTATSMSLVNLSGPLEIGGPLTQGDLSFLRVYAGVPALGASPPSGGGPGGLLKYEFEGNGQDGSGSALTLSIPSAFSYVPSTLFNPVALPGKTLVLRAGVAQVLSGEQSFSPNDGALLSYSWKQTSGPSIIEWSSATTANPTIRGLMFGNYGIELTVQDSSGRTGITNIDYGAVSTDEKGVVILPEGALELFFGSQLQLGKSPWSYHDERHVALADLFGSMQNNEFRDTWNDPQPGTVSVAVNGTVVSGVGTTFKATFCGGGNTNPTDNKIVLFYPRPGGGTGARALSVSSCTSDTELNLLPGNGSYYFGTTASGISYGKVDVTTQARWTNGGTNANYYDNVMAFYSLYYRTGLVKYRDYARTLADRWWDGPFNDQGFIVDNNRGTGGAPRTVSLAGVMIRALDGRPDWWPGIRSFISTQIELLGFSFNTNATMLGDLRESGYVLAFLSLCSALDPNPGQATICGNAASAELARFKRLSRIAPNGSRYWTNPTYFDASWNTQFNTRVNVVNGSNIVTGTGTNFLATGCAPEGTFLKAFRSTDPNDGAGIVGDTVKYLIRSINSPTQITLDRPYAGVTATGRGWQCGSLVGPGTQPFMMGIVASALSFTEIAMLLQNRTSDATDARLLLNGATEWIRTEGYRTLGKGLWYGRYYVNCEPIGESADPGCLGGNFENAREYAAESINSFAQSYLRNQDPSWKIAGDSIFGGLFGKNGGPFSDSLYSNGIDDNGFYFTTRNAKFFGFFYGFGQTSNWPAARLGGVTPLNPAARALLDFDLSAIENAVRVRIKATYPNGKQVTVECTDSPCAVPVDPRQGDHLIDPTYILADGQEVKPSAPFYILP